jgi:hypothetical protein
MNLKDFKIEKFSVPKVEQKKLGEQYLSFPQYIGEKPIILKTGPIKITQYGIPTKNTEEQEGKQKSTPQYGNKPDDRMYCRIPLDNS